MNDTNNTNENLRRYKDYLKKLGPLDNPKRQPTISELVAEGERLLKEEALQFKSQVISKEKLETKIETLSSNPYVKARIEILNKMTPFHRREIEVMEKEGNINNRFYEEFCHNVRLLADSKYPS